MGTDVTAILFYGFPLPKLAVEVWDLNDEWQKEHRPDQPSDDSDVRTPEWDAWRKELCRYETTPEHVTIRFSGCEENPSYWLHCPCYAVSVDWEELAEISASTLTRVDVEAAKRWLEEFCDKFNLPKRKIGWYLAARYF